MGQFNKRAGMALALLATGSLNLVGCTPNLYDKPVKSKSHFEAARTLVSSRGAVPWESVVAKLQPNFTLTADGAYDKVLPISEFQISQEVNAFSAALRLSLPNSTTTTNQTTDLATGKVTGTQTESSGPGTLPPAAALPFTPPAASALPALPESLRKADDNPELRYQLAYDLFTKVQIMNQQLSALEFEKGQKAFLVGIDLDVQPLKRNQPYDVFTDISFFLYQQILEDPPSKGCDLPNPPEVLPILAIDNMEVSAQSRAAENITQLSLALSAVIQNISGAFDSTFRRDVLKALVGKDRNSLFTMGKSSINTLEARIGASRQVEVQYELEAQSHSMYAIVLVPTKYLKECPAPALHVIAQTELIDSKDGTRLENYSGSEFETEIRRIFSSYGDKSLNDDQIKELRELIIRRNLEEFVAKTKAAGFTRYVSDVLWLDLQRLMSSFGLTYERIPLQGAAPSPFIAPDSAPLRQTVIAADDAKQTTVIVRGMQPISGEAIQADLQIQPSGQAKPDIYLSENTPVIAGTDLALNFPSLIELGLAPKLAEGATTAVHLVSRSAGKPNWETTLPVRVKPQTPAAADPAFILFKGAAQIIADPKTGRGQVKIGVELKRAKSVIIGVDGADWDAQPRNNAEITTSQAILIGLSNLAKDARVVVRIIGKDAAGNILDTQEVPLTVSYAAPQTASPAQ